MSASGRHRWRAQLWYDGKLHTIGTYATPEEAAAAYAEAANKHGSTKKRLQLAYATPGEYIPKTKTMRPRMFSGFYGVSASGSKKKPWRARLIYVGKKHTAIRFTITFACYDVFVLNFNLLLILLSQVL